MGKKVAEKLVVKVEYQNDKGEIIKEVQIHELNVNGINSILDIGIKDEDAQSITEKVEEELTNATIDKTKNNINGQCPNCGSTRYKKKTAKILKNNNLQ
jgi:Holliday junction resolvasome RuvABC DNA-binding subunit